MLTQYSEFKTTTLFQQVHFFLIFLSSDFRFSRIITDSIYLSYFSFEEKIEGALKAAVKKKTQWEQKPSNLSSQISILNNIKKCSIQDLATMLWTCTMPRRQDSVWLSEGGGVSCAGSFPFPIPRHLVPAMPQEKQQLCQHLGINPGHTLTLMQTWAAAHAEPLTHRQEPCKATPSLQESHSHWWDTSPHLPSKAAAFLLLPSTHSATKTRSIQQNKYRDDYSPSIVILQITIIAQYFLTFSKA